MDGSENISTNQRLTRNCWTSDAALATVEAPCMERYILDFMGHLRDLNRSPRTVSQYAEVVSRFVAFVKEEARAEVMELDAFDKAAVLVFLREGFGKRLRSPSAATRNVRLAGLRAFFGYLVGEGELSRDPTTGVPRGSLPARSPAYLSDAEFAKLIAAIEAHGTEHYVRRDVAILTTLWHTGLRVGELLSLDVDRVDFEREVFVNVRRKGGDRVHVHFNAEVVIALRRWLWVRRTYRGAASSTALFLSDRGNRLSVRAVEDVVARYVKRAGLTKRITPHSLRHSTATALIRRGVPIEVVAEVLHHRSLDTTRGYVHLVGEEVHAAVAKLAGGSTGLQKRAGK